jgi:hypothetical protein
MLAAAERALLPFAFTAITSYSTVPVSVAGSVNSGRVNPDATMCAAPPCVLSTI